MPKILDNEGVNLPATSYALIELLDRMYPATDISPPVPGVDPMIHYAMTQRRAGARDLINELVAMMEDEKAEAADDQDL